MKKLTALYTCVISTLIIFNIQSQVDYDTQIQPIFDANCMSCHWGGGGYTGSGLGLANYDELMLGGISGDVVNNGMLAYYITSGYMPFDESFQANPEVMLSNDEIALINQWINEGGNSSSGCVAVPIADCMATMQYDPVCGCDGITYSNSSVAACNNIFEYTMGECSLNCEVDIDNDGICDNIDQCVGTWIEDITTGLCNNFTNQSTCISYGCSWTNEYTGVWLWEDVCGWGNQTYEIDNSYCNEITTGCISDIDEDGICEDNCSDLNPDLVVDCECSFFNPYQYTNFFYTVDESTCMVTEDCSCECINDINQNGICDEEEEGCWEDGEFYDVYSQLFVDQCNYYECVVSSGFFWSELMTIDGCETSGCTLSDGSIVSNGWSGNGTGNNWCNSCICENDVLSCTEIACEENEDCGTILDFMNYGNNESFSETYFSPANSDLIITINFSGSTESCCDHIYVNGVEYDGVLDGISIGADSLEILWTSDSSVSPASGSNYGWSAELICEEAIEGCTNPYAENYNPEANTDNGSCTLDCDYLITYQSYVDLNYDNSISNYYCNYYVNNGTYTIQEAINYGYNCDCVQAGCTDPTACNYDPTMTIDDGNCEYGCYMDDCETYPSDVFNCDGDCLSNFFINSCSYYECINGDISNELTIIDGCVEGDILGCTEETACNYMPSATFNDGSCVYDGDSECQDCGTLLDFNNYGNNENFSETYYAPPGLIITINFSGSTESCCDHIYVNGIEYDGVLDGISIGDEVLNIEWTTDSSVDSNSGYGWSAELICEEAFEGCTQPYAENYNPNANTDDGSCILDCGYFLSYDSYLDDYNTSNYYCGLYVGQGTYTLEQAISYGYNCECVVLGCTDQEATNYSEEATIDDCSCTYDNDCPSISFNTADTYLGWSISDIDGNVILDYSGTGGGQIDFGATGGGSGYCGNYCFDDGCYIITMTSQWGGGWSQNTLNIGDQSFTLQTGSEGIAAFAYNTDISCETGCTDPEASNYNEDAILDDGSCVVFGCTITSACNYDPNATAFDGSCNYCYMDNCNLYPSEFYDCDGNCYDLDQDNVCDGEEITGCMDESGCNYNSEATDEGDCTYPEEYYNCNGMCLNDNDGDLVCNEIDNCPLVYNPNQEDLNNDGIGDDCDGVSLNETIDFEWNIYPNPAENYVIVDFKNPKNKNFKLEIRDVSGKIIYSNNTILTQHVIYNNLASGYYILKLQSDDVKVQNSLVIK